MIPSRIAESVNAPAAPTERKQNRLPLVVGAVILAAVIAGVTVWATRGSDSTSGISAAVVAHQEQTALAHGLNVPASELKVVAKLSTVDKSWAWWRAVPSASLAQSKGLGPVYGFDHYVNSAWKNVDNGSSMVGCSTSGRSVPTPVLAAFGYRC